VIEGAKVLGERCLPVSTNGGAYFLISCFESTGLVDEGSRQTRVCRFKEFSQKITILFMSMLRSHREGEDMWSYAIRDRQPLRVESGIKVASSKKGHIFIEMVEIEIRSLCPEVFLALSICLNCLYLGRSIKVSKVDSPWLGPYMYRTNTRATRYKIIYIGSNMGSNNKPHPSVGMT